MLEAELHGQATAAARSRWRWPAPSTRQEQATTPVEPPERRQELRIDDDALQHAQLQQSAAECQPKMEWCPRRSYAAEARAATELEGP